MTEALISARPVDDDARVRRASRELLLERGATLHVLFVCTGNICRSPIAERLTTAYTARFELPAVSASSAGTRAVVAHPMHHEAATVLVRLGGRPDNFSARQFTPKVAATSNLILTMTKAHRSRVLEVVPRLLHKTFTLGEASLLISHFGPETVENLPELRSHLDADNVPEIDDPIGRPPEFFAKVGNQIADLLPPVLDFCQRSSMSLSEPPSSPGPAGVADS